MQVKRKSFRCDLDFGSIRELKIVTINTVSIPYEVVDSTQEQKYKG